MICPQCRAEYRDGVYECADCGVGLIDQWPDVAPAETDEPLVRVFRTADAALLPVIKSFLAAEGIPFLVQGDEASGLFPFGSVGGGSDGRRLGAVVRVPESRAEEAEKLLEAVASGDTEIEEE